MSNSDTDIDWSKTTWEGSRREQLRQWRKLKLRDRLLAVEEMAELSDHFSDMRAQRQSQNPQNISGKDAGQVTGVRETGAAYNEKSSSNEITLHGCTPEPLMSYLKALGVLRLVSEQVDSSAKGFWRDEEFTIKSGLDSNDLLNFFISLYKPSPIFSPWNGDGGFLTDSGACYETIERLRKLSTDRLTLIHRIIDNIRNTASLKELGSKRSEAKQLQSKYNEKYKTRADKWKKKASDDEKEKYAELTKQIKSIKQSLIFLLRNEYPNESLDWLDTCLAINKDSIAMSPLLGSGGVDGRMEFSANYLANVIEILENQNSLAWLKKSLLGDGLPVLAKTSIGQFAPGAIGGANATQGMEGDSLVNPWDYVLMLEGIVLLAGAVSRKLGVNQGARAVFPFTVFSSAAGESSLGQKESRESRGEIWLPLWKHPTSVKEIQKIFSEGRAELCGQQCYSAVDFARAVAALGVDRGITSFARQGFLKRNGLAFIATPLGRFDVHARANTELLREIDTWLDRFRSACKIGQKGEAPARLTRALRIIDSAIFDYCRYGGHSYFQAILIGLGQAERELMRDGQWSQKNRVPPLHGLTPDWIEASWDCSSEFELALSLAGMRGTGKVGPLRSNFEPVYIGRRNNGVEYGTWAEKDRAVVWNQANLSNNLAAVLARRMQDAAKHGNERLPLWSGYSASLESLAAFLTGQTDDNHLEELLWGLMLVDHAKPNDSRLKIDFPDSPPLPRIYALLKPLFLPAPIVYQAEHWRYVRQNEKGITIKPEPRILPLLRTGRIDDAVDIALHRLRSSGLQPMIARGEQGRLPIEGQSLAAALLFPVNSYSLDRLLRLVVRTNSIITQSEGEPA